MNKNKGMLFVISASSGAGKTSLVLGLLGRLSQSCNLKRVITYTTKTPRPREVPGVDYHFLDEKEFKQRIEQGFFLEYSCAYGAYYGFPRTILEEIEKGQSFIGIVDIAGARAIKSQVSRSVLIWIDPPSEKDLSERLSRRAQDSAATIAFRLKVAQGELSSKEEGLFAHILINDTFVTALNELESLVLSYFPSGTKERE